MLKKYFSSTHCLNHLSPFLFYNLLHPHMSRLYKYSHAIDFLYNLCGYASHFAFKREIQSFHSPIKQNSGAEGKIALYVRKNQRLTFANPNERVNEVFRERSKRWCSVDVDGQWLRELSYSCSWIFLLTLSLCFVATRCVDIQLKSIKWWKLSVFFRTDMHFRRVMGSKEIF